MIIILFDLFEHSFQHPGILVIKCDSVHSEIVKCFKLGTTHYLLGVLGWKYSIRGNNFFVKASIWDNNFFFKTSVWDKDFFDINRKLFKG